MAQFPLLKGKRLRATRVNSCGLPVAGSANRIVTTGFVQVSLAAEMKDAQEIEQLNAEGRVCVQDRTPPERKRYNATVELCQVNTGLISLFSGNPTVLNYAGDPVGFRDKEEVDADYGVAIEVWTGGRSDDDCPSPEDDDIFSTQVGSGLNYGYLLFAGTEWRISSDIVVQADVATLTLSGITVPMTQWGRGPYNVVPIDANLTPGRLLEPMASDQHYHLERTPTPPPDATATNDPVPLEIATIFTDPDFYFGGPGGAAAADIAPDQPSDSGSA